MSMYKCPECGVMMEYGSVCKVCKVCKATKESYRDTIQLGGTA